MSDYSQLLYPRVFDNDVDEVSVKLHGKEARGYYYINEDERRIRIRMAREYCEGFGDGFNQMKHNRMVIDGIHLRRKLREVLMSFASETLTQEKREMIVRAFWPKEQDQ